MSIFKRSFRCPFILPHIPLPSTPSRTKSCLLSPFPDCPPPKKNGYVGLKPKCLYFANYTLQNEFFWQKNDVSERNFAFSCRIIWLYKKKVVPLHAFSRRCVPRACIYGRTKPVSSGTESRRKAWKHLIKFTNKLTS